MAAEGSDQPQMLDLVRAMIVTDVRLYREGLAEVLGRIGEVSVVATCAPDRDALGKVAELKPHILLADSAVVRSTDLVRRIAEASPATGVVAFAVAEENEDEVLACAEAGVVGFVSRDASAGELVAILVAAAQGHVRCSPRVAGLMVRRVAAMAAARPSDSQLLPLTRRETEIVALIDTGLSNKEIACQLNIETATVKNHVHSLLEKLRVHRRGEAAAILRTHRHASSRSNQRAVSI